MVAIELLRLNIEDRVPGTSDALSPGERERLDRYARTFLRLGKYLIPVPEALPARQCTLEWGAGQVLPILHGNFNHGPPHFHFEDGRIGYVARQGWVGRYSGEVANLTTETVH